MGDQPLCLFIDVPISAFRPYESREYQDTHPLPPPSAVYGMLLSLVGVRREYKARHRGVALAVATEVLPPRSKVFRKLRRGGDLEVLRPDYQDLLIGLKLWVWLADGNDGATPKLPALVAAALRSPQHVTRSGGLSLGESSYLVNVVTIRSPIARQRLTFLCPRPDGFHNLPTWVDHEDARHTIRRRFDLQELDVSEGLASCLIRIGEP